VAKLADTPPSAVSVPVASPIKWPIFFTLSNFISLEVFVGYECSTRYIVIDLHTRRTMMKLNMMVTVMHPT